MKNSLFINDLHNFSEFGKKTITERIDGFPYFINEFWTSGQRQSHSINEVPFRACFKPELPSFFIDRLSRFGDTIFDPFMGRGTTCIQAALYNRVAFGSDVNPLSELLVRPRLAKISVAEVEAALRSVNWTRGEILRDDLLAFYHPNTLRQLESLRLYIAENPSRVAAWIQMVAITRLSGHSPGFFSGRSMPPNQAVSVKSQLRINEKGQGAPPERDVAALIIKKTKSLLRDGCLQTTEPYKLFTSDAASISGIGDGEVDLTITSPPFLDVVDYASDNWLRCWFAGIDLDDVKISMHKTEAAWQAMVSSVLREQARIIKTGGWLAFEVGEVQRGKVLLDELVLRAASDLPLEAIGVIVNEQRFTKTANCWGVDNGEKGTNSNRIVVFRKW